MADINKLLERLEYVRPTGSGRWMAKCPAHSDGSPSLSIWERDDTRILINCFAGCGSTEVLDSIGLDHSVLYPDDNNYSQAVWKRERDAEQDIIVAIAKDNLKQGKRLTEADKQAVIKARLGL